RGGKDERGGSRAFERGDRLDVRCLGRLRNRRGGCERLLGNGRRRGCALRREESLDSRENPSHRRTSSLPTLRPGFNGEQAAEIRGIGGWEAGEPRIMRSARATGASARGGEAVADSTRSFSTAFFAGGRDSCSYGRPGGR